MKSRRRKFSVETNEEKEGGGGVGGNVRKKPRNQIKMKNLKERKASKVTKKLKNLK